MRTGGAITIIGVLSGAKMSLEVGRVVMKQARMFGIGVGHRNGFDAMMRALDQHRLVPVVDRVFEFDALKDAFAYLKSAAHFGKICIRH